MELPAFLLLLVAMSTLFATIMYVLYIKMHDETRNNINDIAKQSQQNKQTPTNQMPYCPTGCSRGDCKDAYRCDHFMYPNVRCCKFDIQCRDCIDKTTGQVYKSENEIADSEYIDENYKSNDPTTISELNQQIRRQNAYIEDINELVSEHNKPFFEQEQTTN